jgi:hypothetical protein
MIMDKFYDFQGDFSIKFPNDIFQHIEHLVNMALEYKKEFSDYFGWSSSVSIEKIDALNETFYISISREFDDYCDEIELSFYTGIDVGCELVDYSFDGISLLNSPKMVNVLSDIKLDLSSMKEYTNKRDAQALLNFHKSSIMEIYSKQNYDNYVTGGGTIKTDSYYKDSFEKYHSLGLYWTCVYEEIEVDRNIV